MKTESEDTYDDNVLTTQSGTPIQLPLQPGNSVTLGQLGEMRYFGSRDDYLYVCPAEEEDGNIKEKILDTVISHSDDDLEDMPYTDLDRIHVKDFNFLAHTVDHVTSSAP